MMKNFEKEYNGGVCVLRKRKKERKRPLCL